MAITTPVVANGGTSWGTSASTNSFTVGAGEGLLIFCCCRNTENTITGATWNGASAGTAVFNAVPTGGGGNKIAVYAIPSPTPGTGVCAFSASASNASMAIGAVVVAGHDTTTMLRDFGSGVYVDATGGTLTSPHALSKTVASAAGELVIDFVSGYYGFNGVPGAGQSELLDNSGGSYSNIALQISKEDGASSTTMSWTMSSDYFYAHAAMAVRPAAGGGSFTPRATLMGVG